MRSSRDTVAASNTGWRSARSRTRFAAESDGYTFKPAARRAGFPELKMHELRHTFATLALESGEVDMFELSGLTGHENYGVTDRVYAHLRRKNYSSQRAGLSAFVSASSVEPTVRRAVE